MRQRNTAKLIPLGRDLEIRIIGHALEIIPEDCPFMDTLRTTPKLAREIAAQITETIQLFAERHPDEGRTMNISSDDFESAGFPRAAEMLRLMGLTAI